MANIGSLPNMGNRRLSILQKQLNFSRKSTTNVNDKLKESLTRLEKSVDRNKQSDGFRSWQKTVPVKNSLMEIRALKKCLRRRREASTLEPEITPRNGVYDGATLDSMKPEMKTLIEERAPRNRRKKKVDNLKSLGYRDGQLVDFQDTLSKFNHVLSRPCVKHKHPPFQLTPRRTLIRKELPLGGGRHSDRDDYYSHCTSSDEDEEDEDCFTTYESDDVVSEMRVKPRSASADDARTLQLPPIRARMKKPRSQSQSQSQSQSHYKRSLPSLRGSQAGDEMPGIIRRLSSIGPY